MKKFICILLCLMMLIPAAVSQAYTTLDSISVTLTIPKAGDKASSGPVASVPSGAPYIIEDSFWLEAKDNDSFDQLPDSAVFEAGKAYGAVFYIYADYSKYMFSADTKFTSNATIAYSQTDQNIAILVVKFTVPAGAKENICLSKPGSVKLTAVSAKKIKVSWKKLTSAQKKKIKKIQIQVSLDKSFSKLVKDKTISSGKTSYTISGLKKNTKYYVRIRAYTKSGDVINVSKWVVKSKKTKKK